MGTELPPLLPQVFLTVLIGKEGLGLEVDDRLEDTVIAELEERQKADRDDHRRVRQGQVQA